MIEVLGLSPALATAIMGVFVASFAATTLDSATRLQRYVIAELAGGGLGRKSERMGLRGLLAHRYVATGLAVVTAGALAFSDALNRDPQSGAIVGLAGAGKGGLTLWPVFGATNQLLGGLALLVVTVWLARLKRPVWCTMVPMCFMLGMTGWAIVDLAIGFARGEGQRHLAVIAVLMLALQVWIVIEGVRVWLSCGRASIIPSKEG